MSEPEARGPHRLHEQLEAVVELLRRQKLVEQVAHGQHGAHQDLVDALVHRQNQAELQRHLDALHPAFGIISDGAGNLFHHPHTQVLERLSEHHVEVLRTDTVGLVTVRTDGQHVRVETWRDDLQPRLAGTPPGRNRD